MSTLRRADPRRDVEVIETTEPRQVIAHHRRQMVSVVERRSLGWCAEDGSDNFSDGFAFSVRDDSGARCRGCRRS